eukprot:3197024-Prymnesium_polylepis.1
MLRGVGRVLAGGVNVKQVGCCTPAFPRCDALCASWLRGDPRGEHVEIMGHTRSAAAQCVP